MLLSALIGTVLLSLIVNAGCLLRLKCLSKRRACEALSSPRLEVNKTPNSTEGSSDFVATLSHELRTPLTSIRAALRLLSAEVTLETNPRTSRLLHIAISNTERLVRMVNDILDIERVKGAALFTQQCVAEDLVLEAVSEMSSLADEANIKIEVDLDRALKGKLITCDSDRIVQVQCNLLSNALKFSPQESRVLVRARVEAHSLVLCVEDVGRAVPAEMLDTIFEPFTQVEQTDCKKKGGAGLGLAICRAIVHQHGGIIYARRNDEEQADKQGLTIFVHLPLASSPLSNKLFSDGAVHDRR